MDMYRSFQHNNMNYHCKHIVVMIWILLEIVFNVKPLYFNEFKQILQRIPSTGTIDSLIYRDVLTRLFDFMPDKELFSLENIRKHQDLEINFSNAIKYLDSDSKEEKMPFYQVTLKLIKYGQVHYVVVILR